MEDGAAIKTALPASGTVRKHPNHPGIRDGDLENGIIIHEYGHGVSNRRRHQDDELLERQ